MKRELTYADQAKRIKKKYKGRTDKLSMDSMHRELAALEQQQEAVRAQMNLIEPQQMAAWGGPGGYVNQPDNNLLAMGGMIKRADGSYSKRGLWDNIRANKGSGKKPTKQMLEQEKKIKAEYAMGGMMYANGGENNTWKEGPVSQRDSVANMARNTMIWEANRGSGAGTGLSNFGNSALSPGASIDESVDWYMQNIYPKLEAYPTAMEKASAGDFLYNTGKNLLNYTDWDNRKNDTAALASWEEKLKTLTPNERRIALNNARDRYYKNTAPAGSTWDLKTQGPHPAYWNTWYGRQHATDQYTPLTDQDVTNRANKKFYPVQKAMGGEIESAIAPAFFSHGGGIHIDPSKKGTFTAAATKHGKSVQGFASQVLANKENYSPAMVKKANFAKNASKWKHADGGPIYKEYKMPDSTQVNSIHNRFLSNTQTGNNAKTIENWDTSSRLINSYNDGTPNDTSYIYMSPNETFFTSTKLDNGKPMVNHKVSGKDYNFNMPQDSINIYKNKINKNLGFAYGGPMGMYFGGPGDEYNGVIPSEETINKWNQMYPENWSSMSDEEAQPINQIMNEGLLKKYPSSSFTRNLTIPDLKYQPTQPTKPTLNKPFVRYPEQELTIPNLSYKPNTGNSPFYNKNYKSSFGTGTNMNNIKEFEEPKQKFDAGDLAYLGNLASPLIQLFGTKKQPYDYQRVSPELVKYNPNTTADLIRRGSSLPMYLVKKQGLGQGNYLNMMGILSGKAGENIGQANLEGQMKEQIANAGIKNETNRYNAEVQRLQQEAAAKEYAGRLKSYVTAAQGFGNTLSQYVLDKRAGKESEENKQLMKDYTDKHFSYLDKQLEAMKPKSIYDYNSSSTLPSSTLPVSSTFKKSIPTNLEFNLPKSKYGLFK